MTKAFQIGKVLAGLGTGNGEYNSSSGGYRNKIINGSFDIAQRGTNFTGGAQYTIDRWVMSPVSGSGFRVEQLPTYLPRANGRAAVRLSRSSVQTGIDYFLQRIENVTTLQNKKATLTFYAKVEAGQKVIDATLVQYFGVGGSPSPDVATPARTITITTTAQKFSVTFDVPSLAGKTLGTANSYLALVFSIPSSQGNFYPNDSGIIMWDVSLVEGDATKEADPFSPRHPQQEIALCERYYQIMRIYRPTFIVYTGNGDTRGGGWFYRPMRSGAALIESVVPNDPNLTSIAHGSVDSAINVIVGTPNFSINNTLHHIFCTTVPNYSVLASAGNVVSCGVNGYYTLTLNAEL